MEKDNRYQTSGKPHQGIKKSGSSYAHTDVWQRKNEQFVQRVRNETDTGNPRYQNPFQRQPNEFSTEEVQGNPNLKGVKEDVDKYGMESTGLLYSVGKKKRWEKFTDAKEEEKLENNIVALKKHPIKTEARELFVWDNRIQMSQIKDSNLHKQQLNSIHEKKEKLKIGIQNDQNEHADGPRISKKAAKKLAKKPHSEATKEEEDEGWSVVKTRKGKKAVSKKAPTPQKKVRETTETSYIVTNTSTETYTKKAHRRANSWDWDRNIEKIRERKKEIRSQVNLKHYFE